MEIIWRSAALNDLEAIREFIAHDNTEAAIRVRVSIRTAVSRLANYPDLGRAGRVEGTRELRLDVAKHSFPGLGRYADPPFEAGFAF